MPGATNSAHREGEEDPLRRARRARRTSLAALWKCKPIFAAVEGRQARCPKPKVSIIGEFWAMTTEGDGNYQLQRFLESEGAEGDIQLVDGVAPLQHLGGAATTRKERAGSARHRQRASTASASSATFGVCQAARRSLRAATSASARRLPDLRARRRASTATTCPTWTRSPRSATTTTTTISAAAKATWRSAS